MTNSDITASGVEPDTVAEIIEKAERFVVHQEPDDSSATIIVYRKRGGPGHGLWRVRLGRHQCLSRRYKIWLPEYHEQDAADVFHEDSGWLDLRDAIVTAQAEADVMRSLGGSDSKAYQRCLHQRKAAMAAEGVTLQYYFLPGKGPRPDPTRWERFADVVEQSWSVLLAVPLIGATLAVWWISPDRAVTGAEGAGFAAAAKSGSGLSDMLAATCYLVGGVIGLMALFKFKQHDQVPQLPRLSEPIVMALVSGALLTAPALPHPERYRHVPACPPPATADVPIDKAALPAGP